jgi:hypothetical protein
MDENIKINLLKDEYLKLQDFYEDFDRRILTIKGWSATIAIVAIGGGFQYKMPYLWLFASAASLVFWLLETVWKRFQYFYAPRIAHLEKIFREENFAEVAPLQIYYSWFEALKKQGWNIFPLFFSGLVLFPHLITFFTGITLYILSVSKFIVFPEIK